MGSKSRIAKYIVPIIQKYINDCGYNCYIEPFCGGCSIIDKIQADKKFAHDKQKYLIALLQNIDRVDELPEFVTKEHYSKVRNCYNSQSAEYEDWYIGAVGFLASYNGRFFDGGYAGVVHTKSGTVRNYYDEAKRNLLEQIPRLKGIKFICSDYSDINTYNSVIYCDIPYAGTKQYGISKNFDYDKFWNWARTISCENIVLVSEQNAPDDFECIWEQEVKRTIDNTKRVNSSEKLFKYKG